MKLSVCILTWNNVKTIKETLDLLYNDLVMIDHEVIVVDNGSTDGSAEYATIKNNVNLGVSRGKNLAIHKATGEYIALLDGDIVPVRNSFVMLLDWLEEHNEVSALGFYPNKFTTQRNMGGQRFHEEFCHTLFEPKIHTQAIAFYGMFRSSVFKELDIKFPEYGAFACSGYGWEDSDLYMQMREQDIHQWVAGINHLCGKYYHEINSSIRHMGHDEYIKTSKERRAAFCDMWGTKEKLYKA